MILIVGGGLAGLSAAYHLERAGAKYLLVEKDESIGGLCRSIHKDGYTFDYSGHLLCVQEEKTLSLVRTLLGSRTTWFERRASIFIRGRYVPYPFQAHLGALPRENMEECLSGFIMERVRDTESAFPEPWPDWVLRTFGSGMAHYFFFPYHRKLWGISLGELSGKGLEWSVPQPTLAEVVDGALGGRNPRLGYNPQFFYPTDGGIEELALALASHVSVLQCLQAVRGVRWKERRAVLQGGEEVRYETLVSSMPLSELIAALDPPPPGMVPGGLLRCVPIWVLNVGVRRPNISDQHWIYFPEEEFPFFRVGCYTAFGPHLAPEGCSSLYVEVPGRMGEWGGDDRWVAASLDGLCRCGILKSMDEVELKLPLFLPFAYVVFDHHRSKHLAQVLAFLESEGIHPVGRYGRWGYGTMEQALIEGREVARKLAGGSE